MNFKDEQKELLALLPKELKNSQELTDSSKLVLSNIVFLYGMEDAKKNGYVYRTNSKMMEETDIKSEHTLIGAVRLLESLGYIETTRGKRKEASTYKLLIDCSKKCSNNCSNKNSQNNKIEILQKQIEELKKCTEKCTDKCTDKNEKCSNNCSNEIETLQNQVLLLQKQVVLLQKEIENLKNCSKKCSTDTESDTDIDIKPVEETPVVIKENKKPVEQIPVVIKEKKENEMNERSECNEMNANGMSEVKRNDAISSTFEDNSTPDVNLFKPQFDEDDFNKVFGFDSNTVAEKPQEDTTPNDVFKSSSVTNTGESSIFSENCSITHPNPNPFPSLNEEIWKPVVGYEDLYEVSNKGNVKRLGRWFKTKGQSQQWRKEITLIPTLTEKGYQRVELYDNDGKKKKCRVHRLVADAFIPNPNNYPQVNHKDENKQNNHVENLEWCDCQYNVDYSLSKPVIQYTEDGTIIKKYNSISQAERETGYSETTITRSCKGDEISSKYKWKYDETKNKETGLNHSGCVEKHSVEQLPTEEERVQQNARKCPQIEFNNERMQELFSLSEKETNFERFKEYIRQMDEYMQYLRANDPYLFKQYQKEIYCWYQRNTWDFDMNFICVGGDFKRKYA